MSLVALTHAAAQTPPAEPAVPTAAPAEPPGPGRLQYGVRFGPSFTTLTSVETFDETAEPAAFESTMNFGGFFNFALTRTLSLQPEVLFAAKGERIRDKGAPPVITPSGEEKLAPADRVVLVRYLEFPILVRLSKRTHENTSLYVIAGPAFAFRRNAVIREVADSSRYEDIEAQVNSGDLSYIVGGGLQHKRWMADARLVHGVPNIAVDPFPAPVATRAFSVLMGVRF
jgi:Outer membrane protein beta-barrel domain